MKNVFIVVLSVFLGAAIVSAILLYHKERATQKALVLNEEKIVVLNEKALKSDQEISALKVQIRNNVEKVEALKHARNRISHLENLLIEKEQTLSEIMGELQKLERDLDERGSRETALKTELSSLRDAIKEKDQTLSELRENLGKTEKDLRESRTREATIKAELSSLQGALKEKHQTCSELRENLGNLERDFEARVRVEKALKTEISSLQDSLKEKNQTLLGLSEKLEELERDMEVERGAEEALRTELSYREATITELRRELESAQSHTRNLEDEIAKGQTKIRALNRQLSFLKGEKIASDSQLDRLKTTYEALLNDLKSQIENQEVTIKSFEEKISVTFVDRILFDFGKATITPEGKEILRKVGVILKNIQDRQIRVIGHTDDVPILKKFQYRFPSNWELSAARAAAVIRHFQEEIGLDPENLEVVGRSFYDPIADNATQEGRAQNRRVNILIAPKF